MIRILYSALQMYLLQQFSFLGGSVSPERSQGWLYLVTSSWQLPFLSWLWEQSTWLSLTREGACSCHLLCSHLTWTSVRLNCAEKVRAPHAALWKAPVGLWGTWCWWEQKRWPVPLWKSWAEHLGENIYFQQHPLCKLMCWNYLCRHFKCLICLKGPMFSEDWWQKYLALKRPSVSLIARNSLRLRHWNSVPGWEWHCGSQSALLMDWFLLWKILLERNLSSGQCCVHFSYCAVFLVCLCFWTLFDI